MAKLLQFADVHKVYPNGTVALKSVSIGIEAGTVHGVVGSNGAGKSTLVEILAGAREITSGGIFWNGERAEWRTPAEAASAGVATIHQTIPLVPTLSALENVFLWESTPWRRSSRDRERLEGLLERVGFTVDPDALVESLPVGQKQMVAILQALATGADLIVMDEPTASLSREERELIFATVRNLRDGGTTFIYVSHFLDEVLSLTDEITVLRDGTVVDGGPTEDFDEDRLTGSIAGRRLASVEAERSGTGARREILLRARELSSPTGISRIDLDLRAGEIVGLAGLAGSGRSELLHALFGADARATGTVEVHGGACRNSIPARVGAGLALVPEERLAQGLVVEDEVWKNISLPGLAGLSHWGVFPEVAREKDRAAQAIDELAIKAKSPESAVRELSGGNAQKVLFSKWLYTGARIFLLDEPCHGIDVAAKADIIELIRGLAAAGNAVVVADSEFGELISFCNRILIMRRGRLMAETDSSRTDDHELLMLASGLQHGRAYAA